MKLVRLAALGLALMASMVATTPEAQDKPDEPAKPAQPEFKLRLPAAKPEKQAWKARNVVRNGDFAQMHTAWRWTKSSGGIRDEAAREPRKEDYGADLSTDRNELTTVGLTQNLYMPDKATSARLAMDWRLFGNAGNAALQGLTIAVGASGEDGLEAAASPVAVTAATYPGGEWQKLDHAFTADELKKLNALLGKKLPMLLVFALAGLDMTAYIDNVKFVIDGEFTPPEIFGHLAFVDTTKEGYDLVVSTPGGGARETVFSATGGSRNCRGIDWRPDNEALCFASDHEFAYSWWSHDFFELTEKGLRRISNGPSLPEIRASGAATGSVKVKVRNHTKANLTGYIYIKGGLSIAGFSIGPKGTDSETKEVTVASVADLGEGVKQYICARVGEDSELAPTGVDVIAGETVQYAGEVGVSSQMSRKRPSRPSYMRSGDKLVYEMGNIYTMDARTGVFSTEPLKGTAMGWDPACCQADDRVLFVRYDYGILAYDFKTDSAEKLVKFDGSFNRPEWLYDGSGFVYVMSNNDATGRTNRNIALYGMEARRSVLITDVFSENLSAPTLSPDAQWMAVIREPMTSSVTEIKGKPELWVLKVGEPHIGWRIETKGEPSCPCWSRRP
jgi:hypothetical protein